MCSSDLWSPVTPVELVPTLAGGDRAVNRRRWSVEAVVAELRRIHRAGRVRLTANALIAAGHSGLASAIHKHVGSIHRARRLAGIPSPGRREPDEIEHWDEERILAEILARHRAEEPLAYKQTPTKLVDAAVYYYESWRGAIEAAGIDYDTIRRSNAPWTRERIIEALRTAARSNRRGVGADGAAPSAVWLAARRMFGSVRAALDAAGIKPEQVLRRTRLDNDALSRALRRFVREHSHMTAGEMHRAALGRVVVRRFGSIERGLKKLGVRWKPAPARRSGASTKTTRDGST